MAEFKKNVLVVDDDPQIHRIITRLLDPDKYVVRSAENGFEAFEKMNGFKPDLMVLDLMMPGMSGAEVCERVKKNLQTREIRILILSAKDAQFDRHRCFESGADDFVSKPFHIDSLARKIEYMLQKH